MALAGCTVPEIAVVTGHSLRDFEAMLDVHYLGDRAEFGKERDAEDGSAQLLIVLMFFTREA